MFGNLPGWCIAAVLLVATGTLLFLRGRPQVYAPTSTGQLKVFMKKADLSTDPVSLVPKGTDPGDGGAQYLAFASGYDKAKFKTWNDLYARAADPDQSKPQAAKDAAKKAADKLATSGNFDGMFGPLIAGSKSSSASIFTANPTHLINYRGEENKMVLPELVAGGMAALQYASALKPTNPQRARDLQVAVFQLGRALYQERVSWKEYEAGLKLMGEAAFRMALLPPAQAVGDAAALKSFTEECNGRLSEYREQVQVAFYSVLSGNEMWKLTGDVIEVATKSPEPMWQVQALMRLGVIKTLSQVSALDQEHISNLLTQTAARTDLPANVKAAATNADKITTAERQGSVEQY
ncbi:MAG TPA: hypothetical protein VF796_15585 [Humisphaera sp.]